jgi:tripartite-type tricarboxylate transporter receptor subunit TctC
MIRAFTTVVMISCLCCAAYATAQTYPQQPIRLLVPFTAGGPADMVSRIVAQELGPALGQNVVVDYRGGAGTVIGTDIVAKAPPDGYTLLLVTPSYTINPGLRRLPYDPLKDFAGISMIAMTPLVMVVHPSLPVSDVKQLVALAKAKPGALTYGSSGPGSPTHLGMELLRLSGVTMTHVPYKGGAPAVIDLLGGHVQLIITSIIVVKPHIASGKLRAIAVTTARRSPVLLGIPAMAETIPGYEVINWWGIVAPSATQPAILQRLNGETAKVVAKRHVIDKLQAEGAEPAAGSTADFDHFLREDIAKWSRVVQAVGLKVD